MELKVNELTKVRWHLQLDENWMVEKFGTSVAHDKLAYHQHQRMRQPTTHRNHNVKKDTPNCHRLKTFAHNIFCF